MFHQYHVSIKLEIDLSIYLTQCMGIFTNYVFSEQLNVYFQLVPHVSNFIRLKSEMGHVVMA